MHDDPQAPLDDSPQAVAGRHRRTWMFLGGVVVAVVVLVGLYSWITEPPPAPGSGEKLSAREIAAVMKPLVGRLEAVNATGKAVFAGMAVTVAEGEMVTTCNNLPVGGALEVVFHDGASHAESTRVSRAANVCTLKVTTTGRTTAKVRGGDPGNGERVYVVQMKDAKGTPALVETRVTNLISDVNGMMFGIESKETFAPGAAVFDTQGRLAGIINFPHQLGNLNVAYSTSRIEKARSQRK
jgi:hypothetical protein